MHPSGASQNCQICCRGQRAHWGVWHVNAPLDLAIIPGERQRCGAPGGRGPSLDSAGSDAGGTQGNSCAGLGCWTQCLGMGCWRGWHGSVSGNREWQDQQDVLGHTVFFHLEILLWQHLGIWDVSLGSPVTHSPSHPYQQHPQLCHIHGANQHHIPLVSYWVPEFPSLGKRPSCEPFHFPNQMRHKKQ